MFQDSSAIRLHMIRHGESESNRQGVIEGGNGALDSALSEAGHSQAAMAAARLKGLKFADILTSPRQRCVETAMIIAERNQHPKAVHIVDGVQELDMGRLEGKRVHLPSAIGTLVMRGVMLHPEIPRRLYGGEHMQDIVKRAQDFLRKVQVCKDYVNRDVLLVTHSTFIQAAMQVVPKWLKVPFGYDGIANAEERTFVLESSAALKKSASLVKTWSGGIDHKTL